SLSVPANGASFSAPANLTLSATATAETGRTITQVQFFSNGSALPGTVSVSGSTYSLPATFSSAGTYALTAVATDSATATTLSGTVNIVVLDDDALDVLIPLLAKIAADIPPTATLTANCPAPCSNSASISLAGSAADTDGTLQRIEIYNGSTLISTISANN